MVVAEPALGLPQSAGGWPGPDTPWGTIAEITKLGHGQIMPSSLFIGDQNSLLFIPPVTQ